MNNYEKMKNMTVKEMTYLIYKFISSIESCENCPLDKFCNKCICESDNDNCKGVIKQWLESEE